MASYPSGVNWDDREEGEIVDDDFEDISDNSISVPILSGKSVSPKEHLPAISLSSVTDVEESKSETKPRHRRKVTRKKVFKSKKRRNSHRKSICCSDSDNEYFELDKKLQKQLQAAIKVDDTVERHKNSLRSRLKVMTKLDDSDSSTKKSDKEKVEKKEVSDEGDSELAELRLEALRTTILNKCILRKKRKAKENNNDVLTDVSVKVDNFETNKENNLNTVENCPKKICVENSTIQNKENNLEVTNNIENNTSVEEDEDVLRALLLVSMSKKITSEKESQKTVLPLANNGIRHRLPIVNEKKELPKVPPNNVIVFKNHSSKNTAGSKSTQLPLVKPLIINVNQDSDSDDDLFNKTTKNTDTQIIQQKQIDKEIENSVDKFLKEQRAKVEAQLSPIPKCPPKPKTTAILEKSCVKLLPKVKQMEYQKLLRIIKLKNAEKKPRLRRLSHKFGDQGKTVASTSKKVVETKLPGNKQQGTSTPKPDPTSSVKSEVRTLHKILKEIQVQRNGRLQIQDKYKVLMPVIKEINETSVERRRWEDEVKRLLHEITDVKAKLMKSQHDFNTQVNSLLQEKERIDKSTHTKQPDPSQDADTHITSTPIKVIPSVTSVETSSLSVSSPSNTHMLSELCVENGKEEEDVVDAPLNPGDPNDIDKIYCKQKNTFPKYVSPLDSVKRDIAHDPFSILCPFDVDGNCRDPECIYKHLK